MRVAIDASRTTVQPVTGTEHYAIQLTRALIASNTDHAITLYFRDPPPPDLFPPDPRVTHRALPQNRLWTHTRFALALAQDRPDVAFVPAHTLPFVFPGRAVVTVHDLGFRHFPQAHPRASRLYLDLTTCTSAWRAAVVLADSRATADDLTRFYGTPPGKIRVVYPGVDTLAVGDVVAVRAKYHLPARYFLFIGTLQPRKNIARLVQAYARWRATDPQGEAVGLVLAGRAGWLYDPAWVEGVPGVQVTGYVDDADKGALYAGAVALVFPSLYEGFGFPVLEAFHCGARVIASASSSLPELVGAAGVLVDPLDVDAIAGAMGEIAATPDTPQARAERQAQAGRFTWAAAAEAVWDALRDAAAR